MANTTSFDIIIVGGGTAGCVLASRLSARKDLRILVLEAGSDHINDELVATPLLSRRMFQDPSYDWCSESATQSGLNGRVIQHTRGKMLGGSSAINSHSLVFPNKAMHEAWAEISGHDRWGWEAMKDCYKRFLTEQGSSGPGDESKTEGPIQASFPRELNTLQKAWEAAFDQLDAKAFSNGLLGAEKSGFTVRNAIDGRPGQGIRSSADKSYLDPVLDRPNLVVVCGANVEKVIFETQGQTSAGRLRATGVVYESGGEFVTATAERDIIICAGAIGSPKILEQSGIGNRSILEPLGIQCLVDLPGVGENLQDHLNFGPSVELNPDIPTLDVASRDPQVAAAQRLEYDEHKTGPLAEGAAYSFSHWSLQRLGTQGENDEVRALVGDITPNGDESIDLQHRFIGRMILEEQEGSATVFSVAKQRYTTAQDPAPGNYMTILAMLSYPYSRGSCHIKSSDWREQPTVDCAYLSHPLDIEILGRHILQIEKLLASDALASLQKRDGNRLPATANLHSLEGVKEAIRGFGATNYHLCGTCAMMRDDLALGVVNEELIVRGTTNLRVCDASVFPIIPRGNILSSVYAVAEKAAELLLERYSC